MRLFIFRPSKNWGWMGGAVIFAAERFDDIAAMAAEASRSDEHYDFYFKGGFHKDQEPAKDDLRDERWLLELEYEVTGQVKPGLVFVNHHDG
jgi:hypothetical protein